ncbi:MAG: hypothetical protein GTN36_02545 [Candidatus Aenigmarchaeota archaeon]|nr:hypothetical protein [Candidatus Aenigmarchaeota archaeon]
MEKEKKTRSRKWFAAIILIIIVIVAAGLYFNVFSVPTGLVAGTEKTEAQETRERVVSEFTVTGNEVIARDITETLPYYESLELEPGRYTFEMISDESVWAMIYDEPTFNEWKNGVRGFIKTGTGCCDEKRKTDNFSGNFDINKNEAGKYYIVIEGPLETSIKFKITQNLKF